MAPRAPAKRSIEQPEDSPSKKAKGEHEDETSDVQVEDSAGNTEKQSPENEAQDKTDEQTVKATDKLEKQTVLPFTKSYNAEFMARLEALKEYKDAAHCTFSIKHVPEGLKFAQVNDFPRNKAYFLVDEDTRKPVTIFVVGKTSYLGLGEDSGTPGKTANISVTPLDPAEDKACHAFLRKYSWTPEDEAKAQGKPVEAQSPQKAALTLYDGQRFSCWMTWKGRDESEATPKPFTDIFDARAKLVFPRSQMKTLPRSAIELDDLVMVEARVNRYDPYKAGFKFFNACFNLNAVYLLKKHDKDVGESSSKVSI